MILNMEKNYRIKKLDFRFQTNILFSFNRNSKSTLVIARVTTFQKNIRESCVFLYF